MTEKENKRNIQEEKVHIAHGQNDIKMNILLGMYFIKAFVQKEEENKTEGNKEKNMTLDKRLYSRKMKILNIN